MTPRDAGLVMILPLLVIGAVAIWGKRQIDALQDEVDGRPPIAVVDLGAIGKKVAGQGQDAIDAAAKQTRERIAALAAAGFLVIDARSVLAAPDGVKVQWSE